MFYTLALFTALYFATLTLMIGSGLLGSLISLHMALEGFSEPVIGVVMSGFYIGLVGGSFICPPIVLRAGHIRAFAAFAALGTTSTLLYPLFLSPPLWFCFRLLSGASMMGLYMVLESWLNDRTESNMRGRVFSVYMAMTFLGLGSGQFLLKFRSVQGSDLFMIAAIFFALCLIPLVLTRSVHPELPEMARLEVRGLWRRAPLGLLGAVITGTIASAFYSLAPLFCERSGIPVSTVSYFMAITILSGLVLQWPVGNLSDRFDRMGILSAIAILVSVSSFIIVMVAGRSMSLLMASTAIYGGLAFTLYPVAVAHTNDRIGHEEVASASTVLIFCYGLGACSGPPVASAFMKMFGPSGLYLFIGLCTLFLAAATFLHRFRERPATEKATPFVPVPRTSHVISAIDPRGHRADSAGETENDKEQAGPEDNAGVF